MAAERIKHLRDVLGRKLCCLRTTGFRGIGSVVIAVGPDATATRPEWDLSENNNIFTNSARLIKTSP
jgi:hypothetical protein